MPRPQATSTQVKQLSAPPTGAAYLEVQGVPADLVDVGQGAAVVRTLTAGQTEVLGLELQISKDRDPGCPRLPHQPAPYTPSHTPVQPTPDSF